MCNFLFGCEAKKTSYSSYYSESNDIDYSLYYQYKGSMKGVEVYCWNNNNNWYSGLLIGTNRNKTIDEVKWLQDNLPCPISYMKEILDTYSENEKNEMFVIIVSMPPKEEELTHVPNYDEQRVDYTQLYNDLGLPLPNGLINIL